MFFPNQSHECDGRKTLAAKENIMATFTIDSDNNITAHAGLPASADQSQSFSTAKELGKLTAEWPASRLVDTAKASGRAGAKKATSESSTNNEIVKTVGPKLPLIAFDHRARVGRAPVDADLG